MLDQDGFEDWSWLCDQRPYDSLVRESLSDSFATFAPDAPVAALEHLGNEELSFLRTFFEAHNKWNDSRNPLV